MVVHTWAAVQIFHGLGTMRSRCSILILAAQGASALLFLLVGGEPDRSSGRHFTINNSVVSQDAFWTGLDMIWMCTAGFVIAFGSCTYILCTDWVLSCTTGPKGWGINGMERTVGLGHSRR